MGLTCNLLATDLRTAGIVVLPGICCCDAWQSWDVWTNSTAAVAVASLRSQVKRLRRFPSVVTFL
jgi:hypothetical protein